MESCLSDAIPVLYVCARIVGGWSGLIYGAHIAASKKCHHTLRENFTKPFGQHWLRRTCLSWSHLPSREWQLGNGRQPSGPCTKLNIARSYTSRTALLDPKTYTTMPWAGILWAHEMISTLALLMLRAECSSPKSFMQQCESSNSRTIAGHAPILQDFQTF